MGDAHSAAVRPAAGDAGSRAFDQSASRELGVGATARTQLGGATEGAWPCVARLPARPPVGLWWLGIPD